MKAFFSVVVLSTLLIACGDSQPTSSTPSEATTEATTKQGEAPPAKRGAVVRETVSTEKYTFARMDHCGDEAWVAGPVTAFEEGQTVDMIGGMGMQEFRSETLDRTFDKILFVDSWAVSETEVVCKAEKAIDPDKPTESFRVGTVKETVDAAGYTYALLEVCGEEVWIAAPTTRVEVGTIGATPTGNEMQDFKSSALERTFESVWFVPWIKRSPTLPPC